MTTKSMIEEFFGQSNPPKKIKETSWENKKLTPSEFEVRTNFFHNDLATLLEQGPIKKIPARNASEKIEIENTPEIEAQIKEIFWENQNSISF